ncbi:HDIG domain-containing protein [Candidatus Saccharibacteria bacterium]|nr:HDIG domain-containing protein [Candidatus Saccharibacteria bacterium]
MLYIAYFTVFVKMYPTFYTIQANPDATSLSPKEVSLTVRIAEAVRAAGGRVLVVGGYPRDLVLQAELGLTVEAKDIDLEVYGLETDALLTLLQSIGRVNTVGVSFGVFKLGPLDIALPRKDSKAGRGHRGFIVEADPQLSHKDAARRRDFTINAMALDPLTGELFDEHGGVADIRLRRLRAVDPVMFGDDPLRALRGMQFAGRFGFDVEERTAGLIRDLDLHDLSSERIGEEWLKLLLKSERPSIGLQAGLDLGIIQKLHPELAALTDTPQEPEWHPEGSVWNHTLLAVDVAAAIIRREELGRDQALTVLLGALCHDMGKAVTTVRDPQTGRIRSPEHAKAGVELARRFMKSLHVATDIRRKVERIIFDHMFLPEARRAKDAAIRRLSKRLQPATIQELIWVTEADFCGRTLPELDTSLITYFQHRAEVLAVSAAPLQRLVLGRDLLRLGVPPGSHMGEVLAWLEAAQINGAFSTREEGIAYYEKHATTHTDDSPDRSR